MPQKRQADRLMAHRFTGTYPKERQNVARSAGRVPNTDILGQPRSVFYSPDYIGSVPRLSSRFRSAQ